MILNGYIKIKQFDRASEFETVEEDRKVEMGEVIEVPDDEDQIKVGDKVVFKSYSLFETKLDGEDRLYVKREEVIETL